MLLLTGLALPVFGDDPEFHEFSDPHLQAGRAVWLGTCVNCHATGFASAPPVTNYNAWEARLLKPRESLHLHALEGFYGEDYAHMPPRGGNENLSDEEVTSAVDYMLALDEYLNRSKTADP